MWVFCKHIQKGRGNIFDHVCPFPMYCYEVGPLCLVPTPLHGSCGQGVTSYEEDMEKHVCNLAIEFFFYVATCNALLLEHLIANHHVIQGKK